MNWYKLKIAFPINQKTYLGTPGMSYYQIGMMPGPEKEMGLWAIDKNFNIVQVPDKTGLKMHDDYGLDSPENYLAKGRYEIEKNGRSKVSMILLNNSNSFSPKRVQYIVNKIEEILDTKFNNPEVFLDEYVLYSMGLK